MITKDRVFMLEKIVKYAKLCTIKYKYIYSFYKI